MQDEPLATAPVAMCPTSRHLPAWPARRLTPVPDEVSRKSATLTTVLWPGGNVPVCWESAGLDLEKSWARSAVARTSSDACSLLLGNWRRCGGNGCSVCEEKLALYPNYLRRHPKCSVNESCDVTSIVCSAHCPAPTDLDK